MLLGIVFIFGLIIGSFLNVVIYRLGTGRSIVHGRSFCMSCGRQLGVMDLVPVLSFLYVRGKCGGCGSRISAQYPLVELLTGLLFAYGTYYYSDLSYPLIAVLFFILACFVVILVYDLRHQIIPDVVVWPLIVACAIWHWAVFGGFAFHSLDTWAALIAFAFFAGLWLVSGGRWMGFGDAKLALAMGLLLGAESLYAFFISFWIGALVGITLLLVGKRHVTMKSEIPFAPFLVIGTIIVLFTNISLF